MLEKATVTDLNKNRATLIRGVVTGCGGSCTCGGEKHPYEAVVAPSLNVSVGDKVMVHFPSGQTMLSGFMVTIFPLLLFIAGFYLSGRLLGVSGEGIKALWGLLGLAVGVGLCFLYGRLRKGERGMPHVVELIVDSPG